MSVVYTNATKVARMNAVVAQIGASGKLKFFTAADSLLVPFTLASTAGTVGGAGVLTFSDANGASPGVLNTSAVAGGRLNKATVETAADVPVVTGLTIGLTTLAAPAWTGSSAVTVSQFRTNGPNQYRCTVAGNTASSGGPSGTGASIADGTASWEWVSPANADFLVDSIDVTNTQAITVNAATITHAP